jgi:hypothetical protein
VSSPGLVTAAARAIAAFLLLAWLVTRPAVAALIPLGRDDVAAATLAGLPLAAFFAVLAALRARSTGGWRRGAVAASVALAVPFAVLSASGTRADEQAGGSASEPAVEAVAPEEEGEPGGRAYRLRVRGLHPLVDDPPGGPARVEIGARMGHAEAGRVLIEARLVDEATDRTLWQRTYRSEGGSPDAIRRVVAEALRDAMRLTREGVGDDGQEI